MKTYNAQPETVKRDWYIIDATDRVLGRMATEIARRLRGKHKPEFTSHVDTGDYIVVINAGKVRLTAKKAEQKVYHHVTGYISGITEIPFKEMMKKDAARVIEIAVKGMLPKNPLGRAMFRKLKVYTGAEHPHTAQQPQPLTLEKTE